ncbi:MAG TPA: glycosyltransferase family 2 protein, partial [Arenicellales bacterium]|nr:glycosyltransferase family 2 protein [Arenicellales bacterium]
MNSTHIAVVIPSYRVKSSILDVISGIGEEVSSIYVVDDYCPDKTGDHVSEFCADSRVKVLRHEQNTGVGGAVITGYRNALIEGADIVVKIDGDGQMDPSLIPLFCAPIYEGLADYVKGNRFFEIESLQAMPRVRLFGNALLSFLTAMEGIMGCTEAT